MKKMTTIAVADSECNGYNAGPNASNSLKRLATIDF